MSSVYGIIISCGSTLLWMAANKTKNLRYTFFLSFFCLTLTPYFDFHLCMFLFHFIHFARLFTFSDSHDYSIDGYACSAKVYQRMEETLCLGLFIRLASELLIENRWKNQQISIGRLSSEFGVNSDTPTHQNTRTHINCHSFWFDETLCKPCQLGPNEIFTLNHPQSMVGSFT